MAAEETPKKKRGSKGGVKHKPGRDHDRKSAASQKKRFTRKAARKRQQEVDEARTAWQAWDALAEDVKHLLGPTAIPKMPRPADDEEDQ